MKRTYHSPEPKPAHSLRSFANTDRTHIIFDEKAIPGRYDNFEETPMPRIRSEFARKSVLSNPSQSKWKKMFESNGLSHQLAKKKLTHRDIARLSEIINRQATTLKSIRKILSRFEQQIQQQTKNQNPETVCKTNNRQFTHSFSIRIKSRLPQQYISTVRLNDVLERNKTLEQKKTPSDFRRTLIMSQARKKKQYKLNSDISKAFQTKLNKYLEFLLLINLSNRVYRNLDQTPNTVYKYFVGFGNNSPIIHSIMKKRSWWQEGTKEQSNFYWSQIKIKKIHDKQKGTTKTYKKFAPLSAIQRKSTIITEDKPILKLMDTHDWNHIRKTLSTNKSKFSQRVQMFGKSITKEDVNESKLVTNHLPSNGILGNKKALFLSLKLYYSLINKNLNDIIPETYHIKSTRDGEFNSFVEAFNKNKSKIWIVKPGQFSNRGQGIQVTDKLQTIRSIFESQQSKKEKRTYILQHYITSPYLYYRRKFDIRAYMLITNNNGILKGYWYEQGYIRTSSQMFDLSNLGNTYTHLTNDAIQKHSKKYGKYEEGNKLSYADFQRYLTNINSKHNFYDQALPKMKKIATDAIHSTSLFLDKQKHLHNFQVFGLDFMITSKFDVQLIEINTNPCLQTQCSLLARIIPNMLQNAFRIGLDPIFPPPHQINTNKHFISQNAIFFNNFELIFDEIKQRPHLEAIYANNIAQLEEICNIDENKCMYLPEQLVQNNQKQIKNTKTMQQTI